jgi:hypothetical protein
MSDTKLNPPQLVLVLVHWKSYDASVLAKQPGAKAHQTSSGHWHLDAPSYPRLSDSGRPAQIALRVDEPLIAPPAIDGVPMHMLTDGQDTLWVSKPGDRVTGTSLRECKLRGRHGTAKVTWNSEELALEVRDDVFDPGFQFLVRSSLFAILTEEIWGKNGQVRANTLYSVSWERVVGAVNLFCHSAERILEAPMFSATQRIQPGIGRPVFPSAIVHVLTGRPPDRTPSSQSIPDYDIEANRQLLANITFAIDLLARFSRAVQARSVAAFHPYEEYQSFKQDLDDANLPQARKERSQRARQEQAEYLSLWRERTKEIQAWCDSTRPATNRSSFQIDFEAPLSLWKKSTDYWTLEQVDGFPDVTLIKQPDKFPLDNFLDHATYRVSATAIRKTGTSRVYLKLLHIRTIELVTARFLDLDIVSAAAQQTISLEMTKPADELAKEASRLHGLGQTLANQIVTLRALQGRLLDLGVRIKGKHHLSNSKSGPNYSTCRDDYLRFIQAFLTLAPQHVDRATLGVAQLVCDGPKYYEYWTAAYLCKTLDEMRSASPVTDTTKSWRANLASACRSGAALRLDWLWNGIRLKSPDEKLDSPIQFTLWIQPYLFSDGTLATVASKETHRRPDMVLTLESADFAGNPEVRESIVFDAKYQVFNRFDSQMESVAYEMTASAEQHSAADPKLLPPTIVGLSPKRCRGYGMNGRFRVYLLHPSLRAAPLTSSSQPWASHSFYGQSPAWTWTRAIGLGLSGSGKVGSVSLRPERTGDLRRLLTDLLLRCAGEHCDVQTLLEWSQDKAGTKPLIPFELDCPNCELGTIVGQEVAGRRGDWSELTGTCDGCGVTLAYTYCQTCLHHWLIKHRPGETVHSTLDISGGFENARCPTCGSYYVQRH